MAEDSYSLKEMLTEIKLDMREHTKRTVRIEETGLATLEQVKKTNGRVTALESINANKAGALAFAKYFGLFAGGIMLAYLGWLGQEVNELNETLSAYEISVQ